MSSKLISHNADLKKLRDEGYEIEIRNSHLLVHSVPYVNARKEVARGMLAAPLGDMAGDKTSRPQDHVIHFAGEYPCDKDGAIIKGIQHSSGKRTLAEGIEVDHSFSNKPQGGFADYYEKVTSYVRIIEAPAQAIDRSVSARTFRVIESDDPDIPFHYLDTNSSRAEIAAISEKLKGLKVAIVGLGGTGSYVLDFVAKTHVAEIHIFDEDVFLSHNAFRAPGAAAIETLREQPKKAKYLHDTYSRMRKGVTPHEYHVEGAAIDELAGMDFVFICVDDSDAKKKIFEKLVELGTSFVDVGMGVNEIDGLLVGSARVTLITPEKNDHVKRRVSLSDGKDDDYNQNVQIAELNALNAALAVIKWKKLFGFYHDLGKEHHATYDISVNKILNDENSA